ncbi:MAG: methionyl-tRNA formyltransferase [Ktedonobacterales bacterium]|nr:methionyl-tRNA formyltransferase [Ktedonobacterales bacterium]
MRVIFMGTPDFAVPSLLALAEMAEVEIVGVVTRPDKPVGRSPTPQPPPIKVAALARGLPVLQPGSLRKRPAQEALAALTPAVIVVAAFGQILPPEVLALPPHGCLNVHASLLPKYRGASPIASAILAGDAATGNTIMRMDVGLDTGDIITQGAIPIAPDDTTPTLTAKLAEHGAALLARTLPGWVAGTLTATPQEAAQATMTRLIHKDDATIDWALSAEVIARRVRAFTPWPGTQTMWRGQPLRLIAAHALPPAESPPLPSAIPDAQGTVVAWGRGNAHVAVVCGDHTLLELDVLQLPAKRAAAAADVVRGQPALIGATLPA